MDSLTHIALGACMGEAFAGKTVGKKALLWGMLAQSIPDIDFIAAAWLNTSSNLLVHRGFTHSIIFVLLASLVMAAIANRLHRPHNISFKKWLYFFLAATGSHIFLDAFNNYGVGWLEPFSTYRISFNTLYVADPLFSFFPGIALLALLLLRRKNSRRKYWWKMGLLVPVIYLSYSIINKIIIERDVRQLLHKQTIPFTSYRTTPAPLQTWLWFVIAKTDSGYYTGYRSVFEKEDRKLTLQYHPRHADLLFAAPDKKEVAQLTQFSQGYYTVEKKGDTLIFNDLRFGQIQGWQQPANGFAFYYFLSPSLDNKLVVQRGRFAQWDWTVFRSLIHRALGN